MSFLSNVWNWATGKSLTANLAKTAALGFLLNKVTSSINKSNQTEQPDRGARVQLRASTENSVPVLYGSAYVGGMVTDAAITNSNQTMWFCITLCEKTGNLIDTTPSVISLNEVYWNTFRLNFQSDGITAESVTDEDGNTSTDIAGLVKVYFFNGGSTSPANITTEVAGNTANAYDLFPNWTSSHTMNDLVFALVRVDYSREKKITGLADMKFKLSNTMKDPGDCLNDYMTNTRYGAGIPSAEINIT